MNSKALSVSGAGKKGSTLTRTAGRTGLKIRGENWVRKSERYRERRVRKISSKMKMCAGILGKNNTFLAMKGQQEREERRGTRRSTCSLIQIKR